MTLRLHVFDTETTGLKPDNGDRVVEIAVVPLRIFDGGRAIGRTDGAQSLVNPGRPIPPEASAIHHIIDEDVENAPDLDTAVDLILQGDTVDVCAAHNAKFDRAFLPMLDGRRWIDTYRCARHLWPDAPKHNNQTLRYYLGIDLPRDVPQHRALPDAIVTAEILSTMLLEQPINELLALTKRPLFSPATPSASIAISCGATSRPITSLGC